MAALTAADLLNGQVLQFAQGNNDLNPQAVAAMRGLQGQNSGIDMAAINDYFTKMQSNQNAQQLLEQLSADPANLVGGDGNSAPTLSPEALAKYHAMTSDPGSAPTTTIGGVNYTIRQDGKGGYILDSGDTGVQGQQMTLGLNADGTYGSTGAWNPGTTWTNGGRDMAIMAALAAAGGAAGGALGDGAGMAANTADGAATSADLWAQTAAQANGLGSAAGGTGATISDTLAAPGPSAGDTTMALSDGTNTAPAGWENSNYQSLDQYGGDQPMSSSSFGNQADAGINSRAAEAAAANDIAAQQAAASSMAPAPGSASAGIDWTSLLKANGGDIFKAVASLANQNSATAAQTRAANTAADASVFKPFNVTTASGTAGAVRNPDGSITANSGLSNDLKTVSNQALSQGNNILAGVNPDTVNNAGQTAWDKYNAWAKPVQQTMFGQLQDRMAGQGLLGLTSYAPDVNGGKGGNPMYQDFAAGVNQQDQRAYQDIITNAMNNLQTQNNIGTSQVNTGTGIMNQANQNLALGANLANQNNNANANAAQINYGAQSAAGAGNAAMWGNIINAVAPAAGKVINSVL